MIKTCPLHVRSIAQHRLDLVWNHDISMCVADKHDTSGEEKYKL